MRTLREMMRQAGASGLRLLALGMVTIGLATTAFADPDDAPARAVRLSSVDGQVELSQNGQVVANPALANTPLFEGAKLVTSDDGRAEIQFEDGSIARIAPNSSMTLSVLKPGGETGIDLNNGMGYFELQTPRSDKTSTAVRFGNYTITAAVSTVFRVQMDQNPGEVAVFSGTAHLTGPGNLAVDAHSGESVRLNGGDGSGYELLSSIEPDSWDAWNSDRDQALGDEGQGSTAATQNYGDSQNPAWSDLNANGSWYDVPGQGYVWSPYEASDPDWDPYGSGYWVSEPVYGDVWVSNEVWGYMPYQCGLWNYYDGFGWGWAPGGCQPWWGGVWVVNIGNAPHWYPKPIRPHRPPFPRGGPRRIGPRPVIPVDHRIPIHPPSLPPRDKEAPVTIGGNLVEPMRTFTVRPRYTPAPVNPRPSTGGPVPLPTRPLPGASGGAAPNRPGYVHPPENRPRPGGTSPVFVPHSGPAPVNPPHPSGGNSGGAPHPQPAAPPAHSAPAAPPAPSEPSNPHK